MKIISKGIDREIKILTHFKFDTDEDYTTEYVLYTDMEHEGANLYLASIFYDNEQVSFIMPDKEKIEDLRSIIQNLISNNPNNFVFSQKKYKFIDMNSLNNKNLEEVESQKVQINPTQYKNLVNNKYLSYPLNNMLNSKSVQNSEYSKNSKLYAIIASVLLVLFFGVTLLFDPDLSHNLFNFERLGMIISTFQFGSVADYFGMPSSVVFQLGIISSLLAFLSYRSNERKPILFYILAYLIIYTITFVYFCHSSGISLGYLAEHGQKRLMYFSSMSLVTAIIVTLTYQVFKGVTLTITDALGVKNILVHWAIFLALFMISTIGLMLFYDYNMCEHISKFVSDLVFGK